MAERFNWLHLTDLHLGQKGQAPLWSNLRAAFFDDLERLSERCGPWHAVLFTGDLVFSGQKEQFKRLETEVLQPLWAKLKELDSGDATLLAVPGNHDLARPNLPRPPAALRQLLRAGGFEEIAEEFWAEREGEYGRIVSTALENYSSWWARTPYRKVTKHDGLLPGDFTATLQVGGRSIGIAGLNTTFLQLTGDPYEGRLLLDTQQLQAACGGDMNAWVNAHDACLLLTHQGRAWLTPDAQTAYDGEINPAGRFATHLFGHMHATDLLGISQGGGAMRREWQACSLFGMEKSGEPPAVDRRHGYSLGRIEFEGEDATIRCWPRRARNLNGWKLVADEDRGDLEDDGGTPAELLPRKRRTVRKENGRGTGAAGAGSDAQERQLSAGYVQAARKQWDIVDLTGLPEGEREIAMERFMLRQLYMPLRVRVEGVVLPDAGLDNDVLEERRLRERLIAAGRLGADGNAAQPEERQSLGEWMQRTLNPEGSGIAKNRKRTRRRKGALPQASHEVEAGIKAPVAALPKAEPQETVPRFVVLGDPGGGKSTLLRWLATAYLLRWEGSEDFARLPDAASLPAQDWLPILVRCRDLDKARVGQCTLDDLLRQTLPGMELNAVDVEPLVQLLHRRVEEGRALLLVDGLDEITDPNFRAEFCRQLETIARAYENAPMMASARIVGYREMRRGIGAGFREGTLSDLEPGEKDGFLTRWCDVTVTDAARRVEEAETLRHSIHNNDRIERLTGNPMLLTTMALVHRKVGKLPSRRHLLYWEAVELLLRWRSSPDEPALDSEEALPQLQYLAYAMCDRGVQRLRRDEVLELLEAMRREYPNIRAVHARTPEEFLKLVERRTGLLIEAGLQLHDGQPTPVYEFRHLTFQEYLAALALVRGRFAGHDPQTPLAERVRPLTGRMETVSYGFGQESMVTENWREALRLCVAMCNDDDVDATLEAILEPQQSNEARPRAILAALCLADEPNVSTLR